MSTTNSISVCIRPRPWSVTERQSLPREQPESLYLGDGNFAFPNHRSGPSASNALRNVIDIIDDRQLFFDKPEMGSERQRGQPGAKRYKDKRMVFDKVFKMEATQAQVYEATARPLLEGVLDGYNATLFAYGATGCGKTHTISGTPEDLGIIVRTMEDLFKLIDESKDRFDTEITLTFVEIYNEFIQDLLSEEYPGPAGGLKLLENEKDRVTIQNLEPKTPNSVDEVMRYVIDGNSRRSTSATGSNKVSSRSHAVLQINVRRTCKSHEVDTTAGVVKRDGSYATLSIIDLAGSERAAATQNMGERMKEGANINKSLLSLSSCIHALCRRPTPGIKAHIPYRNSKLTRMLKFSLGGNCRTVMIVCVSPSSRDIEDTNNTLVWADRAKNVQTKVSKNTAGQRVNVAAYLQTIAEKQIVIQRLEAEIELVKAQNTGQIGKKQQAALDSLGRCLKDLNDEKALVMAEIEEGARIRAQWDAAMLKISSFDRRLQSVTDVNERTQLRASIRKLEQAYPENSRVVAIARKELAQTKSLDNNLLEIDERIARDKLDGPTVDHMRKAAALERELIAKQVAEARIRGYRQIISDEAEAVTQLRGVVCQAATSLQAEIDRLTGSSESFALRTALQIICTQIQTSLSPSSVVSHALPPLPQIMSPIKSRTTAWSENSFSRDPVRRLKGPITHVASPSRPRAFGSHTPRTRTKFTLIQTQKELEASEQKQTPSDKRFRWPDQVGEGDLVHYKEASLTDTASPIASTSTPESGSSEPDWEEVESEDDVVPELPSLPKATKPSVAPPRSVLPFPLVPSSTVANPSSTGIGPPVPAWKQNRMMMGKTSALDAVTEGSENASPEPRKGLMGPPQRILPSSSANASVSSLFRPTVASKNRMSLANDSVTHKSGPRPSLIGMGRPPLSSESTVARRVSNIGPHRTSRTGRLSINPTPRKSSANSSVGNVSISALSGGAKRVGPRDSMLPKPRRMSTTTGHGAAPYSRPGRMSILPDESMNMSVTMSIPKSGMGTGMGMGLASTAGSIGRQGGLRMSMAGAGVQPWR